MNYLQQTHYEWVEFELRDDVMKKGQLWSESVAEGKESYVKEKQQQLTAGLKESQAPF